MILNIRTDNRLKYIHLDKNNVIFHLTLLNIFDEIFPYIILDYAFNSLNFSSFIEFNFLFIFELLLLIKLTIKRRKIININ